jgi:hypothetical protein
MMCAVSPDFVSVTLGALVLDPGRKGVLDMAVDDDNIRQLLAALNARYEGDVALSMQMKVHFHGHWLDMFL